jgi:hypothetical protein
MGVKHKALEAIILTFLTLVLLLTLTLSLFPPLAWNFYTAERNHADTGVGKMIFSALLLTVGNQPDQVLF